MLRCFVSLSLILVLSCNVKCAKILEIFPVPSYSHFVLGFRLGKELIARGHEVTMVSPYPQTTPIKNYRDISVESNLEVFKHVKTVLFEANKNGPIDNAKYIIAIGKNISEKTLENPNVQKLLNSKESFDLVIMAHFLNDAHAGIAHHFNAPLIIFFPTSPGIISNYIFANPAPSSYVPNLMGGLSQRMTFLQRTQNLLLNTLSDVIRELIHMPIQRELFKKYIKTDLELDDVLYNASLMFTNSHLSVNIPVPLVPSIIEIGGFHVDPPKKLPDDLQNFLDGSKDGVVLFSMGSNLQSKDLNPEVRTGILKALGKIKQNVLWKFESELPEAPANVKIMTWLPQQDILAHPNVRAFISHGGMLSTIEAVYHGVPVIGIPVFGDQKTNIAAAVHNGYAVSIPLPELSEEKLTWALDEILNNPKYWENVKQRSRVMHDRPQAPLDTAIFWIEHVIRHRGAPHLRNPGVDLRWYQRNLIDVFIVLTLVTIGLFVVFYIIIKRILGLCSKRKTVVTKSKKNR